MNYLLVLLTAHLRLAIGMPAPQLGACNTLATRFVPMAIFVVVNSLWALSLNDNDTWLLCLLQVAVYNRIPPSYGVRFAMLGTVTCLVSLLFMPGTNSPLGIVEGVAALIILIRGLLGEYNQPRTTHDQ